MTKSRRNTIIDRKYSSRNSNEEVPYNDNDEKKIRFVRITEENGIYNGMTLYFVTSKEESFDLGAFSNRFQQAISMLMTYFGDHFEVLPTPCW